MDQKTINRLNELLSGYKTQIAINQFQINIAKRELENAEFKKSELQIKTLKITEALADRLPLKEIEILLNNL
jgi:hypothetical protein